jgi:hypothetical protein
MAGPPGLHVTYGDISRMLLESVDDSGSTDLSKSRDSDRLCRKETGIKLMRWWKKSQTIML